MTRRELLKTVPAAAACAALSAETPASDLLLWDRQPATQWTEALPVGNGRLGAMVFGGPSSERLQLNEDTLWSGYARDGNNPEARRRLVEVRRLVLQDHNYAEAENECKKMQGLYTESYLPLGDLMLRFEGHDDAANYRRELNLDTAIVTVSYTHAGATFTRQFFASVPDQAIVVRLSCDKPGSITFAATLDSLLHHKTTALGRDVLLLRGKAPSHVVPSYLKAANAVEYDDAPGKGMRFEARLTAFAQAGRVTAKDDVLRVEGADSVTLLLTAATGYRGFGLPADGDASTAAAPKVAFRELRARHVADHQLLFRRVSIDVGTSDAAKLPTDERVKQAGRIEDRALAALHFQYGRYLLIASSRPGTQPANLQGIWNDMVRPPWSANFTININTQMNYWPAEVANLAECHLPLFDLLDGLSVNGRKTAQVNYGLPGWVAHHNTDLWRPTCPVGKGSGDPEWANWAMAGGWLSRHLWEHYAFGGDREFLRKRAYPVMKGAAEIL